MSDHNGFYTVLGRSGVTVSRLCVGTVNIGGRVEEPEARRLLDCALAHGINFIDTADSYGWRVYKGYTEEVLGRWWAGDRTRRDRTVLATKVGTHVRDGPNEGGLSLLRGGAVGRAGRRRRGRTTNEGAGGPKTARSRVLR